MKSLYVILVSALALVCFMVVSEKPNSPSGLINFIHSGKNNSLPLNPSSPSGSSIVEYHIIVGGGIGHGGVSGVSGVSGGSGGIDLPQPSWPVMDDIPISDAGGGGSGNSGKAMTKILELPYDATLPGGERGSGIPEMAIIHSHSNTNPDYHHRFYPME